MKPLFTVHGGEYLVGSYLERRFKRLSIWIPSRDTGIDLLVSDRKNRRSISIQVKFSKDYLVTHKKPEFQEHLRAIGWWAIKTAKLQKSKADFWVFVLLGFDRSKDFVVVPKPDLLRRLRALHGSGNLCQIYLSARKNVEECWETRPSARSPLSQSDELRIAQGTYRPQLRNFSKRLNAWKPIERLNR